MTKSRTVGRVHWRDVVAQTLGYLLYVSAVLGVWAIATGILQMGMAVSRSGGLIWGLLLASVVLVAVGWIAQWLVLPKKSRS